MDGEKLPEFEGDEQGYPVPGPVVKHYREKKGWTQRELGNVLRLSEVTVRKMEKDSMFLDSITRRRALCETLGIPFALLGVLAASDIGYFVRLGPKVSQDFL